MKIRAAILLNQAFTPSQIPIITHPQVAVLGRSNVGKSSLLARMMMRKKLVKVSSTPGKTRGIFFYLVNDELVLVDLPGYGFSKAPKSQSSQWRHLVEAYLDRQTGPFLALHLIDIRHPPTEDDITVHRIVNTRNIPSIIVATKADKLSRSNRKRSLEIIARNLDEPLEKVVPVSARVSSIPVKALWERVNAALEQIGRRKRPYPPP